MNYLQQHVVGRTKIGRCRFIQDSGSSAASVHYYYFHLLQLPLVIRTYSVINGGVILGSVIVWLLQCQYQRQRQHAAGVEMITVYVLLFGSSEDHIAKNVHHSWRAGL